ncbi:MAG: thiol reductase thioredoxin, partial [Lentisphaeria bacterium]|nr:thiol reductase thioredoxin [Lentisphaeria bacterium]
MSNVLSIKADDWVKDVLEHDGDVLVDFWGNNCAPCTTLAPIIE